MKRGLQRGLQKWDDFWFGNVPLLNLGIFRFVFCFTMALMYMARQKDVALFYTDEGILPKAMSLDVLVQGYKPAFNLSFWPDAAVPWVHGLLIVILLALAFGVLGRVFAWIAVYLQLAFLFRNYGVAFGADQIGTIFLLYLSMTKSNARFSVVSWWRQKQKGTQEQEQEQEQEQGSGLNKLSESGSEGDALTSVFYRMIQIQLCLIYVYSGMEKLKGLSWWDGTAVWSVLANSQMVIADLTWLRHFPLLVVFISFTTILFEIYFPVLVWVPALRNYVLGAGVFFHAGIGVVMALWSFAVVMLSSYILFVPENLVASAIERIRFILRRT